MSDNNMELLHQAIDRNTPIALLIPSAGMMRSFRSRLLSIHDDGILLESIQGQGAALDELIKTEQPVNVSFRSDTQKVEFSAPILRRIRDHKLNATMVVEAVELAIPKAVKAVQRRSDYRVVVPGDSGITFKFWRIGEQADLVETPLSNSMLMIDVRDFSGGGIGGTWKRRKEDPPSLVAEQRVRVEIDSSVGKVVLDARLRFLEKLHEPELQRIGIQFTINPTSIQDRQKVMSLNKLMGELQRMELRRKKLAR